MFIRNTFRINKNLYVDCNSSEASAADLINTTITLNSTTFYIDCYLFLEGNKIKPTNTIDISNKMLEGRTHDLD